MAANVPVPADLFRFMALRQPQLPSLAAINTGFIRYTDAGPAQLGAPVHSDFYEQLAGLVRTGGATARAAMVQTVTRFRQESRDYIPTPEALYALFPGFRALNEWLTQNKTTANLATLQSVAGQLIGKPPPPVVGGDSRAAAWRVWDNLFSQVVVPDNPRLREDLLVVIRILRLQQRLAAPDPGLSEANGVQRAAEATILIPLEVAPPTPGEVPVPDAGGPLVAAPGLINATAPAGSTTTIQQIILVTSASPNTPVTFTVAVLSSPAGLNWLSLTPMQAATPANLSVSINPAGLAPGTYRGSMALTSSPPNAVTKTIPVTLEISAAQVSVKQPQELVISVGGALIGLNRLCPGDIPRDPCNPYEGPPLPQHAGLIKPLGIGDLLVVQQQLLRYDMGEVAHIENVLATETRSRTHRHLQRRQETFTQETDTTQETERDTQTAERFTLESETSQTIKSDTSLQAGVTLSASYGPVTLAANASYASSNSLATASKVSRGYAKDVTQRAASKLTEKVVVQRTQTTLDEVEETNLHAFDNSKGSTNVVGIYRWIDKFFQAQVVNYGSRLMFEFIIPEPAAFYIFATANNGAEGGTLAKPVAPDADGQGAIGKLTSFKDVTADNFAQWAARYGVQDVSVPPVATRTVSLAREANADGGFAHFVDASMQAPEGYEAESITVFAQYSHGDSYAQVSVAGRLLLVNPEPASAPMNHETGIIPIGVRLHNSDLALTIVLTCRLTQTAFDAWRLKTYSAILAAYQQQVSEYQKQLAATQSQDGFSLHANPPDRNRAIEKEELKKGCLELFTAQKFESFDAMRDHQPVAGYPEFDDLKARQEGAYMQFFEQAFEWEQMTYLFYPYFWGRKPNWVFIRQYEDADSLFAKFLQAGAARAVVPVHPAYTKAVLHYLQSDGEIWNGDDAPSLDDPLYISIADEIKQADGNTSGKPVGDPWEIKVPTTLVMLEPEIAPKLPDFTNPVVVFLQSRASGTANLAMGVKNTGGAPALNVTVTSITILPSPGATLVYDPGLLNVPFIVPGAADLKPGDTSGFNLNFKATAGSAGAAFSFVITVKADNMLALSTIINVP